MHNSRLEDDTSRTGSGYILPAMQKFVTVRDAKTYLIERILGQASQDGIELTDVERKMLYFSVSGWTLPDMMTISSEFDQHYDQDEYERKIAKVVQHIHKGNADAGGWTDAVHRLRSEDHYLLVLIDGAPKAPAQRQPGDTLRLIVTACFVVAVQLSVMFMVSSYVSDQGTAKAVNTAAFVAVVVCAVFLNRRANPE